MVENIEDLRFESKIKFFFEIEIPAKGKIQLVNRESTKNVPSETALPVLRWNEEWPNLSRISRNARIVKALSSWCGWIVKVERDTWN